MTAPATPAPPNVPEVVVFDVNETLTDMSPVGDRLEQLGAPRAMFATWFASVLRDGFALTAAGSYADFADLARHQLTEMLDPIAGRGDLDVDAADAADRVLAVLPDLDLHPDVAQGLHALRDAGMRLVTLTNGASAMSDGAFARAGVSDLFEHRLSVTSPRTWKPAAGAYRHAVEATGTPADRMALVAVHPWDIDGATRAGLAGAWLDRTGASYPAYFLAPAVTGRTLPELAHRLVDPDG